MTIRAFGKFMFDPDKVISVRPQGQGAFVSLGEGGKILETLEIDSEALKSYREWVDERAESGGVRSIPLHRR